MNNFNGKDVLYPFLTHKCSDYEISPDYVNRYAI